MTGEHLDLSSEPPGHGRIPEIGESRNYLGVTFACCGVYARVYINRDETAYVGYCPKCTRPIRLRIGPDGTDCRFFTAY
jgi:hypothetical protein